MKVGRNDPCPCGSGKKYKKCCMHDWTPANGVLTMAYEYGTSDPFIVRFLFQILKIRDLVYPKPAEKEKCLIFDNLHTPIFQNLMEARMAKERLKDVISQHKEQIKNGTVGRYDEAQRIIRIDKSADLETSLFFKDFFIRGTIAIKNTIALADFMGYKISFLFGKDQKFSSEKEKFLKTWTTERHSKWLAHMENYRNGWYKAFANFRGEIEHKGFELPKIKYVLDGDGNIKVKFPMFDSMQLDDLLNAEWEGLYRFCEEIIVFLLSTKLPPQFEVALIPKEKRDPAHPIKYALAIRMQGEDKPTIINN